MIKQLDVVLLKSGLEATVLEAYSDGNFLVEIADDRGRTIDMPVVTLTEIEKVIYIA